MINTEIISIPAYTTRSFRNFGLHNENSLYKFMFTKEDRALLNTGAIKLIPQEMCKYSVSNEVVLNGKKYYSNDIVNPQEFDEGTLMVLLKTNVIKTELKEDFINKEDLDIVKTAKLYDCVGLTFKKASEFLNIDFDVLKDKFELKQGGSNKKITKKDIETLLTLEV